MSKKTKMIYGIRWSLQAQIERIANRAMNFMCNKPNYCKGRVRHFNRQLVRLHGLIEAKDVK